MRTSFMILIITGLAAGALAQPFTVVPTPNPSAERNLLRGVSGTADDDVWVVGDARFGGVDRHILYHWDGTDWSPASAPFLNDQSHQLFGVSMLTAHLGWAAGFYSDFGTASAYIVRWDGGQWSLVHDQPGEPTTDIWAVAPDDVWAVGTTSDPRPTPALTLHWDGDTWQRIDAPLVADRNHQLDCVHASGPDNVWAAGFLRYDTDVRLAYVIRWDGDQWHALPSPASTLTTADILTFAPDDTWIALDVGNVWHWDGGSWSPSPIGAGSLAGLAPDDIYAFGALDIHHWDGESWTVVQTLPDVQNPAFRNAAQALPDGSVWAVGREIEGADSFRTLAIHRPGAPTAAPAPALDLLTVTAAPNPFNPRTRLALSLAAPARVTLTLHDLAGRRVRTLLDGLAVASGASTWDWDGTDEGGRPLPTGTYFARATAGQSRQTTKLLLLR